MTWDRVFAAGMGVVLLGGLVVFMYRTPWGEALNAVGQSRESAAIVGIDSTRFYRLAFGLGGALAGGAGALVGPIYSLSPSMGLTPDTQAFAIVILGGMGSIPGAMLAGLLIGLSESMFVALFPDPSRALTYAQAFSLVVLMMVLLVRPTGLFGRGAYGDGVMWERSARAALLAGAAVVLLGLPQVLNGYWLSVGITALFYAIVASSWALLVGYAGQFSFGHMAFVSMGAYTSGMLAKYFAVPIPLGMVAGVLACAITGCLIGYVCLRMRGPYLALFTVAFSEVLRIVLVSEAEVTGGSGGLEVPTLFHGRSDVPYYYVGLALLAISLALMGLLSAPAGGCSSARSARTRTRRRRPGCMSCGSACWPSPSPAASPGSRRVLRAFHRHPDPRYRLGRPDGGRRRHGGDRRRGEPDRGDGRRAADRVRDGSAAQL